MSANLPHLLDTERARPTLRGRRSESTRSYWISASCSCALASSTFDRVRPPVKIGCVTCGTNCQTPVGPLKETRQLAALRAQQTRQADSGIVGCLGDADHGICGDELLLRGADVGTPFEQMQTAILEGRTVAAPAPSTSGRA